jgi:beta-glucosidase
MISPKKFKENDAISVTFTVKNSGMTRGAEIAQLYIQDVECSLPRPAKELKGFQKVDLEPGQSKTITLTLNKMDLSFWSPEIKGWLAEKGKFVIQVGSSSNDIRLKQEIELL